ncbi:MAG: cyclic nucleotide-binding domain-containing protein [Nitrospinae bacterium]|nr:cyclic nucleotide-binding domain-containing protein [Nitrospinota bacterium]
MSSQLLEKIPTIPLFGGLDSTEVHKLIMDCEIRDYEADEQIYKKGDYADFCSILLSGTARVELPAKGTEEKLTFPINQGQIFGEISALCGSPRTADIVAATTCTIINLDNKKLFVLFDKFPSVEKFLNDVYRSNALENQLHTVPIFTALSNDLIKGLCEKVSLKTYKANEIIFNQGDDANDFNIVRYGFLKVSIESDGKEKVLAYLKNGQFFGEMALLKEGEKRTATITATSRVELIQISRESFDELVKIYPKIKFQLERVIEQRKERTARVNSDATFEKNLSSVIDLGVIQTKALLLIDQTKCVQCDNCVKACAAMHNGHSRLTRHGTELNNFLQLPTSCRHCEDPTCMMKCPTGAITRGADGEIYHKDHCIGCGSCAKLCPYGNITIVDFASQKSSLTSRMLDFVKGLLHLKGSSSEENSSATGSSLGRFMFPGDRDMVERGDSEKLPGDRDMVAKATGKAKKRASTRKATKCDMCREYEFMGCVYNCPKGAARRVNPTEFFSEYKTAE